MLCTAGLDTLPTQEYHTPLFEGAGVAQWQRVVLVQYRYSTLGPVSAWMGDRLWTGKPLRDRTTHPGRLSPSHPSMGTQQRVLAVAPATGREEMARASPV